MKCQQLERMELQLFHKVTGYQVPESCVLLVQETGVSVKLHMEGMQTHS